VIAETVRTNGWLIFYSHDVDDAPSRLGVSPDLLAHALATARNAGCLPVTIADGLRLVRGEPPARIESAPPDRG